MSEIGSETVTCKVCGAANDAANAICTDCNMPLTAYSANLSGQTGERRQTLEAKSGRLAVRPPAVTVMVVFTALVAVFWPLGAAISAFLNRPTVNAEGTNYIGAAFGSIGPIFTAVLMIPIALALFTLAWMTWQQQQWTWTANLAFIGAFALFNLRNFNVLHLLCMIAAGVVAFLWLKPETKTWYGY